MSFISPIECSLLGLMYIVSDLYSYSECFETLLSVLLCLLFVGSVVGLKGNAGQCVYSASKAGLEGFTRSLAKEVASRNIRVNLLAPGTARLKNCSDCASPLSTRSGSFVLSPYSSSALMSRFHPHRHDRRAEGGGRGALHPAGEIRRAGRGRPGCPLPFGVSLHYGTGAGGGWRAAAGHVGTWGVLLELSQQSKQWQ